MLSLVCDGRVCYSPQVFNAFVLLFLGLLAFSVFGILGSLQAIRAASEKGLTIRVTPDEPEVVTLWSNPSPGEQVIIRDSNSDDYLMVEIQEVVQNPDKSFTWDVTAIEPT